MANPLTRLVGSIQPGDNKAHINFKRLMPRVARYCSGISGYGKDGTINVHFAPPCLLGRNADCWTPRVTWKPDPTTKLGDERDETFGFMKIKFEFPEGGKRLYNGWIILPEGVGFSYDVQKAKLEVIAKTKIKGVNYGELCAVHIDHTPSIPPPWWFSDDMRSYQVLLNVALFLRYHRLPFCNDCLSKFNAATIHEIERVTKRMLTQQCFASRDDICSGCNRTAVTIRVV
jgi:hypothetical protein